jgi:molybdate transport system substrate-binding protein
LFARKLLIGLALFGSGSAQEITVAAAADTSFAVKEIATKFEQERRVKVKLVFGASGNLFAQIQNGAPYDVFLSADEEYAKRLQAAGLVDEAKLYATNGVALLYRKDLSPSAESVRDLSFLLDPRVKRIAIANPQHAPFGRAAMKYVLNPELYERVKEKVVLAENIAQTTQYAVSGNADVAIVSRSMAEAPSVKGAANLTTSLVTLDSPIRQAGGVLANSEQKDAARSFFAYLGSTSAKEIWERHGFALPTGMR